MTNGEEILDKHR